MNAKKPSDGVLDKFSVERVLTDWINAIENFRILYVKLVSLIPPHSEKLSSPLYIGQCPADSLVTLILSMQKELEQLLVEIDALEGLSTQTSPQTIRKLIRHTQRLNRLIDKANVRFQLMNVSSS
jgi:hypothetical protein